MQKMRSLLANRKLLKRKLIDVENHIRGTLRAYGLLMGAVGRGGYEARVRELLEHSDPIFSVMIEAMLDAAGDLRGQRKIASRASSGGSARRGLPPFDDGAWRRSRCHPFVQSGGR